VDYQIVSNIPYYLKARPKGVPFSRKELVWFQAGKPLVWTVAAAEACKNEIARIVRSFRAAGAGK
jgi:hypothetical protein